MDEGQNVNDPTECSFSGGEFDDGWFARVTAKCPICGRRTVDMLKGKGTLSEAWPQKIKCKNRHEFEIVPYRWTRSSKDICIRHGITLVEIPAAKVVSTKNLQWS